HPAKRSRPAETIQAVFVSGRNSEPRRAGNAWVHSRRRRTRLFDCACLRRGLRQPELLVCCVVGDGESETGPLAGSWHSNKFLNPARDGAVLPILHLNGYKIANPTVPGRMTDDDLVKLYTGYGYKPIFVEGNEPAKVHQEMARTLDAVVD